MVRRAPFNVDAGRIYPPYGAREGGARIDFRSDIPFDNQIEWHGTRFAWTRMTICPCKGINNQTDQIDPGCTSCNGLGWKPFQTPGYFIDYDKTGPLTEEQKTLVERNKSMIIRGVTTSMTQQPNMFAALGNWALGSVMITVRADNKLGYYDRLTFLDDTYPFSEVVTTDATGIIKLRYPARSVNALVSLTHEYGDADVYLENGNLVWLPNRAPAVGTRLSVHYMCHPVFVVIEFAHMIRVAPFRNKKLPSQSETPMGDYARLPLQVVARLEHLPLEVTT